MRLLSLKLLNILFLSLFALALNSQNNDGPVTDLGTTTNDGDGLQAPLDFCLDADDNFHVRVNVVLDGLDLMGISPNEYGVIPSHYPDMFVEFTVNGVVYTPVPVGVFDPITLPSGYPAFSSIVRSPAFNFTDECEDSVTGQVLVNINYRLVTQDASDGWKVYPACDYTAPGDLFSCQVYSKAPWCAGTPGFSLDLPGSGTSSQTSCSDEWFSGSLRARLLCDCDSGGTKSSETSNSGYDYIVDGEDESDTRASGEEETIKVYPNPMQDLLQVEYGRRGIKQIAMYNMSGELMLNQLFGATDTGNVTLNTSTLPNGLYLVKITTNEGIEVVKVLK